MEKLLFTSEAVSEGHPDKVCDQIADRIFDACLAQDPNTRSAVECFITDGVLVVGGEVTTKAKVDYKEIAKKTLLDIGYDHIDKGFDANNFQFNCYIHTQSPNISDAVSRKDVLDTGAGDQGMMFGYATIESNGMMPLAHVIANKLVRLASERRKESIFKFALPDMKAQVTIDYSNEAPKIDTILMSVQHQKMSDEQDKEFKDYIRSLMKEVAKSFEMNDDFATLVNPSGLFEIGGPKGDTGLTGRKIVADTYGGFAPHGGGAFSGKDSTKVDRSGAYAARYVAKNLVASGVCTKCEIQVAYAIGVSEPVSISVKTFGTNTIANQEILRIVRGVFDLRPGAIITNFNLRTPSFKYGDISNYGHFGRTDLGLPWEKTDKVDQIKSLL